MKRITPTELRRNLYRLLDEVAEGGESLSVDRHGKQVVITTAPAPGRLDRLVPHDAVVGDSEDLAPVDWSAYWTEGSIDA